MSIWYFQLQSSALPTELSRDALVGRKIRRHKVVPGTDMYVAKPLRTELHVVYVMTLVLIDLRSVCVFALRNNMLNGKMYSIGSCKRTQAWHPHNIRCITYLSKQSSFYHDSQHTWLSLSLYILLLLLLPFDDHAFYLLHLFYDGQES